MTTNSNEEQTSEQVQKSLKPNRFQYFQLSPEEEVVASTFNPVNTLHLQNLRYQVVQELLNDAPQEATFESYHAFFLRRGIMTGRLELLDQLIGD